MARLLALSILMLALPAAAVQRDTVVGLLRGYEWHPDKAALDRLGPDVYRALIDIAGDNTATNLVRGRAMAALTLYPNDEVWAWFAGAVSDTADGARRRRLVDAMCDAFAAGKGDAVESLVAPLLAAGDVHLRISAAKCLRKVGGSRAEAALAAYRQGIRQPWEARAAGFKEKDEVKP